MVIAELLSELQARGVTLKVQDDELLTMGPKRAITPLLGAAIRQHKAALLLTLLDTSPPVTPAGDDSVYLPGPIARLVIAAAGNHLHRPGLLPSGIVMNLGEYVLTAAALYAAGIAPEQQLADLWGARTAWEPS